MINTSTTISDVIVELPYSPSSDMSGQFNINTRVPTVYSVFSDGEKFAPSANQVPVVITEYNMPGVSGQVAADSRTATVFAVSNDTNSFLPWYTISQSLVDTTIGNTIQVVQQSPIRQVWG